MPLSAFEALEETFQELLRIHAAHAIDLPPDTITPVFDDFDGRAVRAGMMRYGQGALVDIGSATWVIGLGMKHCPGHDDHVLADLAAIRIFIPDETGDPACIAPPPREPHRIIHEALVTNNCFESSFVVACRDGSIAMPPQSSFTSVLSALFLPRHLPTCIANETRGVCEPITYIPEFPAFLAALLGVALTVQGVTEIAGIDR